MNLCDFPGCSNVATRITYHHRKHSGTVTAYWCKRHYEVLNVPA